MLWTAIVTLVVALAIYVSFGRMLMSNVEPFEGDILGEMNTRLPFALDAEKVSGQWHFFSPELVFTELELSIPGSTEPPYRLTQGRITLDVLASLRTRSLQVSKLVLDGLSLRGRLSSEGKFTIAGIAGGGGDLSEWIESFLLNIESVDLTDNVLALDLPNEQRRQLQLDMGLRRDGSRRVLEAKMVSSTTGTVVSVIAEGVGNPMAKNTFDGELYLNVAMADIGAFAQLIDSPGLVDVRGGLDAEIWLGWEKGEPSIALSLAGQGLEFTGLDQSWHLPVDELSMVASLVERKELWTMFVSEFEFQKDDVRVSLPALQLDTWGDSVRLRTRNVPLAPFNALLVNLSLTPEAIADVFEVLDTRGELSLLQLSVADVQNPFDDWEFTANFHELEIESWRGAPGIRSGAGYVELAQRGGELILDSQSFSMTFPTVYAEPLSYDDVFGTINIDWDADDFSLSSGVLTLRGEEGLAHVLFGLNVPLGNSEIGLEMDLLVGLQDFDPGYRSKYLPYILSDSLLGWLQSSIGEGSIDQGAFLWRGNLKPSTPKLKTIQLFFNISDITLNYHPDWPVVSGVDGIVLIDDTNVSVWSESANLYDSKIEQLSAEAWMDPSSHMILAISGSLQGPAEDGLKVVNNSPITDLVGPVFESWQASGLLHTDLQLQMNLGEAAQAPDIKVDTSWDGVDLQITPGNLQLSEISGQFSYNSDAGFSSNDLSGRLWGRELTAKISQGEASAIEVAIATRIDMADIQQWLDLGVLALGQGETDAAINVEIVPQQGATLSVVSQLKGVKLDLPDPWAKLPEQKVPFNVNFPLGGASPLLALRLGTSLQFDLQLAEGRFIAGALGLYQAPGDVELGVMRVTGHSPIVDTDQWQAFVDKYIQGELLQSIEANGGLSLNIDRLGTDTLLLLGQDIPDVVFSLHRGPATWNVMAETDWVSGTVNVAENGDLAVAVQSLDLDKLGQLDFTGTVDDEPLELPDMTVSLEGLKLGGRDIGELDFLLQNEGDTLTVRDITGSIAGLQIDPEKPAAIRWKQSDESSETSLQTGFRVADLATTLEKLGYEKILETDSGKFELDLSWPGGPLQFSLLQTQGTMAIALEEGRFLSAATGASGALRVLNILNLAEIIGRLSLTHMFESGIPFHSVDGEVFLDDGNIEVASLEVDGRTSSFQFSGVADAASETLEGQLAVTLPVANNLPWIVALTAGPAVAAGVFVVSKVFEKQVNRFSSGVYQVSGPWDDPKLDFIKIFDDTHTTSEELEAVPVGGALMPTPHPNTDTTPHKTVPVELDPNEPAAQEGSDSPS
ncbi:MAG: hypothetical protein ACI8QT_000650 [Halioglobus sp.]